MKSSTRSMSDHGAKPMARVTVAVLAFAVGSLVGAGTAMVLQHQSRATHYRETASAIFVVVPGKLSEVVLKDGYAASTLGDDWRSKVFYYSTTSWLSRRYKEAPSVNVATLAPLAQGELPRISIPREDASPAKVLLYSPQDKTSHSFSVDMRRATIECTSSEVLPDREDTITATGELVWRVRQE